MRKHWSIIESNYKEKKHSAISAVIRNRIVTPTAVYSFEKEQLKVGEIPSVFISKSTLQEFVEYSSKNTLEKIAKKIAAKDFEYIMKHMIDKSELRDNPLLLLERLNELANDYYWGQVSYKQNNCLVEIKIGSDTYASIKGKHFYDKIYFYFMQLLGYKLVKRNTLDTTYTYKKVKD